MSCCWASAGWASACPSRAAITTMVSAVRGWRLRPPIRAEGGAAAARAEAALRVTWIAPPDFSSVAAGAAVPAGAAHPDRTAAEHLGRTAADHPGSAAERAGEARTARVPPATALAPVARPAHRTRVRRHSCRRTALGRPRWRARGCWRLPPPRRRAIMGMAAAPAARGHPGSCARSRAASVAAPAARDHPDSCARSRAASVAAPAARDHPDSCARRHLLWPYPRRWRRRWPRRARWRRRRLRTDVAAPRPPPWRRPLQRHRPPQPPHRPRRPCR